MDKLVFLIMGFWVFSCNANTLDYKLIEKNLKSYEKKLHSIQQNIDNSVFNSEEILLKLDFDTDNLIAFLQEKFVFQPYVGLLRGVQGTLNSRSGNALDQAVLLAKLLGDAGLETRVANGVLTDNQTKQLLSGIANANIPTHIGVGDEFKKAIEAISNNNQEQYKKLDWHKTETFSRYSNTLETLQKLLKNNNISLEKNDITKRLINESKQYFWVQYRLGVTDDWKNAHPAFSKGSKINVKPISHFKESVPEKYLHQVRIEVFIQQRLGTKFKTHSLMKAWQKPAANLQNSLITYSNGPSGVNLKSDYDLDEILQKTTYFIPTFNGSAVGGKVFDLKGRLIDSMGMNSQAGALFQTLGDKTLLAIDKIEGKKDGESSLQLTAQWLQFTFINPDGSEFVQKRYIYQADENKNLDNNAVKFKLMTEYALLVNNGEQPLSYLAKVYIDMVADGLPLLKASARKLFKDEKQTPFPKKLKRSEFELLTQYYWMNSNPDIAKNTIHYRSNPNLMGFKRGYINAENAFIAVDVISNKQQFIQKQAEKYFNHTEAQFKHGIWETASEWLPARMLGLVGKNIDTLKITSAAQNQQVKIQVLKDKDKLSKLFVHDKNALNRILADVKQGYLVVVPETQPQGLNMTGWWRINLVTGETLGMTADGGGQSATEYAIELVQQGLFIVRAIGNLKKCEKLTNDSEKLCCLAEAHFNNVGGLAFGSLLGATLGTVGAAIFDIVDFTAEIITGTGIAPSTNGKLCEGISYPNL